MPAQEQVQDDATENRSEACLDDRIADHGEGRGNPALLHPSRPAPAHAPEVLDSAIPVTGPLH
jgi:hypothetical protein